MGPILGLGVSLAINDVDLTRRSLKNLIVMVVLSVLTAFLFFYIFPLREESSELLARTEPVITDVIIAFFGGLGLIIARTKKGTIASVIFGVAIATALMPPLCTVGYGLAIGKPLYAAGAMYLFIINSIFIALATFLVIKYLRFPMVRYANSKRRRTIARVVSLTGLVVMIPAGFTFYEVLQESLFEREARAFLEETVESYQFESTGVYRSDFTRINYNHGKNPEISLVFIGDEVVPQSVINTWEVRKNQYKRLRDARLVIPKQQNNQADAAKYVLELYESKKAEHGNRERVLANPRRLFIACQLVVTWGTTDRRNSQAALSLHPTISNQERLGGALTSLCQTNCSLRPNPFPKVIPTRSPTRSPTLFWTTSSPMIRIPAPRASPARP
jgi:uncharacterized hydrophobic protein (TIGR00271 family)